MSSSIHAGLLQKRDPARNNGIFPKISQFRKRAPFLRYQRRDDLSIEIIYVLLEKTT